MTRPLLLALLLSCFVAPYLVTPRPAPESPSTVQGRTGASHGVAGDTALTTGRPLWRPEVAAVGAPLAAVRITGTATWCAPTPRYCHGWGGKAMLAAVPSFRYGDEPYTVQVTGFHGGKANAVLVTVVSYCDCGRTVIDLSPHAFAQLAPLSVGRIRVIVDGVRGPAPRAVPTAPATNVEGSTE